MAVTISFGIQKGGVGKTTTAGITAYLLSEKHKVLAVDFDSQGNLTYFLTQQNIYDFTENTILEAVKEKNPTPYIHKISKNLHILPAEDFLATFSRYLYQSYFGNKATLLKETLTKIKNKYDYIIIDLPPNLGDQTINGLVASNFAVVLLQSEPFALDALDRYLEILKVVQKETNPNLLLAGILPTMLDSRAVIDSAIIDKAKKDYEDVIFNTIIKRRSRIKEFTIEGITNKTKSDKEALSFYQKFKKELINRVKEKSY